MRHLPKFNYCGLTIVLSNPSRFDRKDLLSGFAGTYFNDECLRPGVNRWQCDIRTADTKAEGLLPGTKALLLLGEVAFKWWSDEVKYKDYDLSEQRGCPLDNALYPSIPTICSYLPQDALDVKDFESSLNSEHIHYADTTQHIGSGEGDEKRRHGVTARRNWKFFLKHDTKKILSVLGLQNNVSLCALSKPRFECEICPNSETLINFLSNLRNSILYLDIETDANLHCNCIGVSGPVGPVYSFPIYNYTNHLSYHNTAHILHALALAMSRNCVVIFNSMFDLFVLGYKYHISCGKRIFDPMLAQHRIFPEVEKSLGHAMSLWTWEQFHKDEGIYAPKNHAQDMALMEYNAKDVFGMRLVHQAICAYTQDKPGLQASIDQANASIRPYLISTFQGMNIDEQYVAALMSRNDRLMNQYLRILTHLVGYPLLPSSPPQCVNYFHSELNYKPVGYTATRSPSLKADLMYLLKLHYPNNAAIDFCLRYRELKKESGMLKFTRWNLDQGLPLESKLVEQKLLDSVQENF